MIANTILEKLEYNKVLNYIVKYCITENGKENILSLTPYNDSRQINREGQLVNDAKEILIHNEIPPLEYLPDLDETIAKSKIEGSVLESKKLLLILKSAVMSRVMYQYLKNNSEMGPLLYEVAQNLFIDKMFEHHIQKVIDENGEVKDNASSKLREIRVDIRRKNEELIKSVNRIMKSLNEQEIVREEYMTLRDGRIVIPVKVEHKRHIRGFIHSESSTGQTVYIEPEETLELNNEIISLTFAEKREIDRILRELTKQVASAQHELRQSLSVIAYLDSLFARAKYSIEIIGAFPEINNSKPYDLQDARHPILLKKFGKNNTVPLNVKLDKNRVVVITGPNAGGKTVVLKTLGLLSLMIQSGIHIPAAPDSNLHLFGKILLDIGDEQSIEDDLSTFSSHLSNIKNILKDAEENSLVLLDEIGTGTDPSEGAALAAAVLVSLKNKKTIAFATTHHGSLKLLANEIAGFENAAMEFDSENLEPTYRFKQGIPGSSYAFEVAQRIGLSEGFLNLAKEYLDPDKHKLETFLVDIEAKSYRLNEKLKKVELENTRLNGLTNLYQQNLAKLEKEKKEILKKAKKEADDYLKGINKKIEHVIKEIKESNAESDIIKLTKETVKEIKKQNEEIVPEEVDDVIENNDFKVGDFVILKNTQTSGEIVEIAEAKKKALIKVGGIKMQVPIKELAHSKKKKETSGSESVYSYSGSSPKIRLDIRGERADSAEFEVIRFIDESYTAGLDRIEILHGKGTGALKKTVKDILKNHDKVKNFYFAPVELGGDGITIAELK